ncbi:YolD-like family protein [Paenibacillus brasilensis]|nr:YolD-like family protein [Paenibacillus brasilensis]
MENYPGSRRDERKKWNSAFILPEHRKRINEFYLSQNDVPQPALSSDELEELNYAVLQYLNERCAVEITYYRQKAIHRITGYLIKCDPISGILTLQNLGQDFKHLLLSEVLSIRLSSEVEPK